MCLTKDSNEKDMKTCQLTHGLHLKSSIMSLKFQNKVDAREQKTKQSNTPKKKKKSP